MSSRSNKNLKVKLINRKDKIPEYSGVSIKTHKFMKIIKKLNLFSVSFGKRKLSMNCDIESISCKKNKKNF